MFTSCSMPPLLSRRQQTQKKIPGAAAHSEWAWVAAALVFFACDSSHFEGVMMSNKQRRREEVLKKLCIRLGFVPGGSGEDVAERVKAGMGWGKYICSSVFLSLTS
jgi:hypothetical protein